MNGSLDGSTSSMIQRSDGFDVAFIFNGRNATTHLEIQNEIESLIERLR
jgi:hypothetical protein